MHEGLTRRFVISGLRAVIWIPAAVVAWILILEAGLHLTYFLFKPRALMPLEGTYSSPDSPLSVRRTHGPPYPSHPGKYLKVAVFGESSAWGLFSAKNFADIIGQELQHAYPGREIYVRNYGTMGATFHGYQAEIAKAAIPYYDVLMIYAAHNELWTMAYQYGNRFGVYDITLADPREQYRRWDAEADSELKGTWSWRLNYFLFRHSMLRALIYRVRSRAPSWAWGLRLASPGKQSAATAQKWKIPPVTADRRVLPEEVVSRMPPMFAQDLKEIREAAEAQGKTVLLATQFAYYDWPPFFSKRGDGVTEERARRFDELLSSARARMDRNKDARRDLSEAVRIDPHHALANFLLGESFYRTGDVASAWPYWERAIDNDGFPVRRLSVMNDVLRDAAAAPPRGGRPAAWLVDSDQEFRSLIGRGMRFDQLLADWVHPTLVGHVLIARNMLCALSRLPDFKTLAGRGYCEPLSPAPDIEEQWRRKLDVGAGDFLDSRWPALCFHYNSRTLFSDPRMPLQFAAKEWCGLHAWTNWNERKLARFLLVLAVLKNMEGDKSRASMLLERAAAASPQEMSPLARSLSGVELTTSGTNKSDYQISLTHAGKKVLGWPVELENYGGAVPVQENPEREIYRRACENP